MNGRPAFRRKQETRAGRGLLTLKASDM